MLLVGYMICLFYLWFGYKIFTGKTFGSFLHQFIIIITCFSLYASFIFFIFTKQYIYLGIPCVPYIVFAYNQDRVRKKMKNIVYKKN